MATVSRLLTNENWLAMPPAGEGGEEIVNGELQVLPPKLVLDKIMPDGDLGPIRFPGVQIA
jgi:hypothetical protein